jgi:hypothetical protein
MCCNQSGSASQLLHDIFSAGLVEEGRRPSYNDLLSVRMPRPRFPGCSDGVRPHLHTPFCGQMAKHDPVYEDASNTDPSVPVTNKYLPPNWELALMLKTSFNATSAYRRHHSSSSSPIDMDVLLTRMYSFTFT